MLLTGENKGLLENLSLISRLLLDARCCCDDIGEIVLGAATIDLLVAVSGRADDLLKNGDALDLAWTDASAFEISEAE